MSRQSIVHPLALVAVSGGRMDCRREEGTMEKRFEVFRLEKLATESHVARSIRHDMDCHRKNEAGELVPMRKTADPTLSGQNQYSAKGDPEERARRALNRWRKNLPEKRRKNAVVGAQAVFSFSHEMLEDKKFRSGHYLIDCLDFCKNHFGGDNIVSWAIHMDETTPHISVIFLPKDEKGNLNARKIFGNKKTMSEWQDRFHEEVGQKHGLERGIQKTGIYHQTLERFYGQLHKLDQELDQLELSKKNLTETWDNYFERTRLTLKSFVEPMLKPLANLEAEIKKFEKQKKEFSQERKQLRSKEKFMEEEIEKLKNELSQTQEKLDMWKKITPDQLRQLANQKEQEQALRATRRAQNRRNQDWER